MLNKIGNANVSVNSHFNPLLNDNIDSFNYSTAIDVEVSSYTLGIEVLDDDYVNTLTYTGDVDSTFVYSPIESIDFPKPDLEIASHNSDINSSLTESQRGFDESYESNFEGSGETSYGKSSDKIGDFTNLECSTVDDILDRIPDDAVLRELRPVQGGATEGFEFKWTWNGQTYRVRVHNSDPSAPVGTNAYNGWVVRVQRGKWYYDPTINDFREAKYFNPTGPFFDETIVNNTHIPIHNPYDD